MLIFSTHRQDKPASFDDLLQVRAYLERHGINPVPVKGSYKGEPELSLIVRDLNAEAHVERLARFFGQDSYLRVGEDGTAVLVYHDGRREPIGVWINGTGREDAFTEISGHYYTVR